MYICGNEWCNMVLVEPCTSDLSQNKKVKWLEVKPEIVLKCSGSNIKHRVEKDDKLDQIRSYSNFVDTKLISSVPYIGITLSSHLIEIVHILN